MSPEAGSEEVSIHESIAIELDRVQEDSYGTSARSIDVTISENLVVAVIDPELAANEQTLVDAGRPDAVKAVREEYQEAIRPIFNAIVERATGRRVTGFASSMSMDPLFAVEVFRLQPVTENIALS